MMSRSKAISMFNLKGGVGETSSIHLLAWALARSGVKVIVFDLDTQMSVSWAMMSRECYAAGMSWTEFMKQKETIHSAIANVLTEGKQLRKLSIFSIQGPGRFTYVLVILGWWNMSRICNREYISICRQMMTGQS